MERILKEKRVSYGKVELRDAGAVSPRYRIYLNGTLREYSDNLYDLQRIFDTKYY